jgi:hypothetical protein
MAQGVVSDAVQYQIDGNLAPLSLTNDGRLRVATVAARVGVDFFTEDEERMWGAHDTRYWGGFQPEFTFTGSPWSEW